MSIAKHHAEWLSLLEISGPFLNLNTLNRVFPQGLDTIEPARASELRAAYEEWSIKARDPRFHRQWVLYVLQTLLGWDNTVLAEGQAIPEPFHYTAVEHGGERIRPTFILHERRQPNAVRALVSVYEPDVALEKSLPRALWSASPAARMLTLLHATGVQIGLVTNGEQWMLVSASKTGMAGFISWYADLWNEERLTLRAFVSLLEARRFFGVPDEEILGAMLDQSADDAQEVTDQLGMQVRQAVEILVRALDRSDQDMRGALLDGVSESRLYEAALTVMMRLVFLLSAEERGLFLLGDELYDQNYAISTLRAQLHEAADSTGEEVLERRSDAWSRLLATFRLVYYGASHQDLKLPAYGGSLFDPARFPFLEGGQTDTPPAIDNRTVLHLLDALQILQTRGEARRLSFRALDIEQIGHVYEGLLDHEARRAEEVILGFDGSKNQQPEIPLSVLEAQSDVAKYLKEMTGRSSVSTIKNALGKFSDADRLRRLFDHSCRGERTLFERVMPYLNLLRDDEFGNPLVVHPGSVYVTSGTERRATGTHYTPRSLTEPVVEHTLEPLVYRGVAEGMPPEAWELKSPRELLALKVCDMAMGSGAFLVQACRYLAARLIEAWERRLETEDAPIPRLTIDGDTPTGALTEILIPDDSNERMTLALRLVADRCLYGVDKNPLAVEMAKLSLWLTTLAKGRPFTFLDHALKCGDSLVGVSLQQLRYWKLQPELDTEGNIIDSEQFIGHLLKPIIAHAGNLRQRLEQFTVNTVEDQQEKARLYAEAEASTAVLKTAADHLIAELMGVSRGSVLAEVVALFQSLENASDIVTAIKNTPLPPADELGNLYPFHWEMEFPEVFFGEKDGFDALIGNPPYLGGKRISTTFGDAYKSLLDQLIWKSNPNADLCAKFHLRGYYLLRRMGAYGLVSTDRIAEGDTREGGLDPIFKDGGRIYVAETSKPWPGAASVRYSPIHVFKGNYKGAYLLDGKQVEGITTSLTNMSFDLEPQKLLSSWGTSYVGCAIQGAGFILEPPEANALIEQDKRNSEIVRPFLTGGDLNHSVDQSPLRWVINFDDRDLVVAKTFPLCLQIVEERVKPYRDTVKRNAHRERWWQFGDRRPGLVNACKERDYVIACTMTTVEFKFAWVPSWWVFDQTVVVIAQNNTSIFTVLESEIHKIWAVEYGSGFGSSGSPRYNPSRCYETFPFPQNDLSLSQIGEHYHETRRQIMLNRQEGLTATYNRFHNPDETSADIQTLRDLHRQMDEAVAAAYGWDDLPLEHDFHETAQGVRYTISDAARREVLKRLLALNFERYEEEVRLGLHDKGTKKGKRKAQSPASSPANSEEESSGGDDDDPNAAPPEQLLLFDDGKPKQKRLF